ncbi:MAG TPA: amidohydrolase family protein [Bryobacteraceae bacterium]|jgi:predicted TIM-barrel fold metal-dependent hydrolase|nr:amidohydrolase family protein [Bryobacteraceae bacterium]
MKDGFRIYDTHTHLGLAQHSGRSCSADQMLACMDRCGVDRSLAIPFPMVEDYRAMHDLIGAAVRAHPDRLSGAACLNPFIPQPAFRGEVRRCAQEFGFRVLKFQPQYQPLNPISPRADFFFETALENRMSLVCHTGTGIPFALPSLFMMPARRFPQLKFVLAHCGGGGVLLAEAIVAAVFCPNIYLELSSLMPHHVLEALAHVPASRMMIGSDLPESLETEIGKILRLEISAEARQDILWNTASSVFEQA